MTGPGSCCLFDFHSHTTFNIWHEDESAIDYFHTYPFYLTSTPLNRQSGDVWDHQCASKLGHSVFASEKQSLGFCVGVVNTAVFAFGGTCKIDHISLSPVFPLLLLVIVHLCTAEEELCSSSEESSSVQIIQPIQQSRTNNTSANQTNNKDGCRQIYRRTPPSSRPHLQQQRRQNHLRLDLHLRPLSLLSLRPNSSSHLLPQHFRCHSEWRADQIDVFFQ